MNLPIYPVDAFTHCVFSGNPAAVVVLENEAQVRGFQPDHPAIERLDAFALIVTARGDKVDFVSRKTR